MNSFARHILYMAAGAVVGCLVGLAEIFDKAVLASSAKPTFFIAAGILLGSACGLILSDEKGSEDCCDCSRETNLPF